MPAPREACSLGNKIEILRKTLYFLLLVWRGGYGHGHEGRLESKHSITRDRKFLFRFVVLKAVR